MEYFFSHARTALKFGVQNLPKKSVILVPEFICNTVTDVLKSEKFKIQFYSVNKVLKPNWESFINPPKNCSAILMVHYFGIPQDIEKFISYAIKNKLCLIEDNAHGYGGKLQNRFLGSFGDFSISSPRKLIQLYSGGILKINNKYFNIEKPNIAKYPITLINSLKFKNKNKFKYFKFFIKKVLKKRPPYEDNFLSELPIKNYKIDDISKKLLENFSFDYETRINNFNFWHSFAIKNNLTPLFSKINDTNLNPWCYPAYVSNSNDARKWFDWGWKNNLFIFSWPNLPIEAKANKELLENRSKLICFSTSKIKKDL